MLRLLKQEDFAILFASELASSPRHLVSLAVIGKAHGVSIPFLKKLARDLRKAGLVESKEGAGGGYRLAKGANSISVLDIMEAVGERKQEAMVRTYIKKQCPLHAHCLPQTIRERLGEALRGSLRTISLHDLVHQFV